MQWDAGAKANDKRKTDKTEKKVFPLLLLLSSPDDHSGAGHGDKEVPSLPHRQQVDEKSKSSESWGFSCSPWPCQGAWSCTLALAICSSSWRTLASLLGRTMRSWWQTSPEWRFFKCNKFLDISLIVDKKALAKVFLELLNLGGGQFPQLAIWKWLIRKH